MIPAQHAPQTELRPILPMAPTTGAFLLPQALRQLLLRYFGHVLPIQLPLVAVVAEVSATPAKPHPDVAAKFTLEGQELLSMLRTVLRLGRTALGAHQPGSIKLSTRIPIGFLIHHLCTTFPAPKIGLLALEALEISIYCHRIFRWLLVET